VRKSCFINSLLLINQTPVLQYIFFSLVSQVKFAKNERNVTLCYIEENDYKLTTSSKPMFIHIIL